MRPAAILICVAMLGACRRERSPAPAADDPIAALDAAVARGELPGLTAVVVLRGGETTVERSWAGTTGEDLHDPRSVTKSLTALAVGAAIADGHLRGVDEPAFAFFADLRPFLHEDPRKDAITVGDLLKMASALDCNDDDPDSPGNEAGMYPARSWARWVVDLPVRTETSFAYCTAGTLLLGEIVARAVGRPYDEYVEERILAPLGIHEIEWARSEVGEVMSGGSARLRPRDLARLGELVRRRGEWNGTRVLPASWIDACLTLHTPGYGYLFWRETFAGHAAWLMSGNGGNKVIILDDLDAVVVIAATNYNRPGMHVQSRDVVERYLVPALVTSR